MSDTLQPKLLTAEARFHAEASDAMNVIASRLGLALIPEGYKGVEGGRFKFFWSTVPDPHAALAAPPEPRDTPPRHKDREKAWEAFKVDRYGTTSEAGLIPGVRVAFDFAWDAAVAANAASGAAGATTAAAAKQRDPLRHMSRPSAGPVQHGPIHIDAEDDTTRKGELSE